MFSRRHPILFFVLIFSAITGGTIVAISLITMAISSNSHFDSLIGPDGGNVGIVEVTGLIGESKRIIEDIKHFRENDSIKAIVLRIDSPGGSVGHSQEIFREIQKTSKKKKVVASMGSVAASGGYYIAAGTNSIVANPGTITGSIGVIMSYTNIEELLGKIGLASSVIKSGKYKDMGSPIRKMTKDEEEMLGKLSNEIHTQFINDICQGRSMDLAKVKKIADGRILTGQTAMAVGLVDQLGNLEDAVELAGQLGGVEGKISGVYAPPKKPSLMYYLFDSSIEAFINKLFLKIY